MFMLCPSQFDTDFKKKFLTLNGIYIISSFFVSFPGWFRAILPKTALRVEEESWNAYPYTKTRYTCPFIEKFSLEVETKYLPDAGHQDNVFNLSSAEAKSRYIGQ